MGAHHSQLAMAASDSTLLTTELREAVLSDDGTRVALELKRSRSASASARAAGAALRPAAVLGLSCSVRAALAASPPAADVLAALAVAVSESRDVCAAEIARAALALGALPSEDVARLVDEGVRRALVRVLRLMVEASCAPPGLCVLAAVCERCAADVALSAARDVAECLPPAFDASPAILACARRGVRCPHEAELAADLLRVVLAAVHSSSPVVASRGALAEQEDSAELLAFVYARVAPTGDCARELVGRGMFRELRGVLRAARSAGASHCSANSAHSHERSSLSGGSAGPSERGCPSSQPHVSAEVAEESVLGAAAAGKWAWVARVARSEHLPPLRSPALAELARRALKCRHNGDAARAVELVFRQSGGRWREALPHPLHAAVDAGNARAVRAFVHCGADVEEPLSPDCSDELMGTPLAHALAMLHGRTGVCAVSKPSVAACAAALVDAGALVPPGLGLLMQGACAKHPALLDAEHHARARRDALALMVCHRVAQRSEESQLLGMPVWVAQEICALLADNACCDGSYGLPMADRPPDPSIILQHASDHVAAEGV